jgi:hypothetical protein
LALPLVPPPELTASTGPQMQHVSRPNAWLGLIPCFPLVPITFENVPGACSPPVSFRPRPKSLP